MQLARRRAVALKHGFAHRRVVLYDSAVARAQSDELPVEDRPSGRVDERLQQGAEAIAEVCATARPGTDAALVVDGYEEPESIR
jgi:hypothetical protein